jgi:predicted secreted protein
MPTAALAGRFGSIKTSTSSTNTAAQTAVAELTNYRLTVNASLINVTSHDSSGWEDNIVGIRSWEGTADVVYLSTGAGQAALRTTLTTATPNLVNFSFKQSTSDSAKKWQGAGYVTSWDVSHGTDEAILGTISFRGARPLTRTA